MHQEIRDYINDNSTLDAKLTNKSMSISIQEQFNSYICPSSVANIRQSLGYRYRPPLKIQKLSEEQKMARLQFAHFASENLQNEIIIFSDESRFALSPDNNWVYIKKGKWTNSAIQEHDKFDQAIMF